MGKKITDEDLHLNIKINGSEAKNELYQLEERVRDLTNENTKLERSLQRNEKQLSKNGTTVERYQKTLEKEKANYEKQVAIFNSASESVRRLYSEYKRLDSAGKESKFGKRLYDDVKKQEEAMRRSRESGEKSKVAIDNLTKSIGQLEKENQKLIQKRTEDSASLKKNQAEIESSKGKIDKLRQNLDITTLSIEELNREISRTNALFRTTDPNDPKWKEYQRTLIALRTQQQRLSQQAVATKGVLCRMADGVNQYWNLVVTGAASLAGVVLGVKNAINQYVSYEDVLADARKTTGLTDAEIRQLNEDLKKMDTRTAQEELMGLVRIGGKLGIEGSENLKDFVLAADQLNVALGEDFGGDAEEAIRQVGKIVDIFKVKEEFGIGEGMLKVGSIINELGAASTANEGYIVEFTKRVAGVAPSAGVSVDAVMGLAATLDQLGQTSEVSSTVYSQVMTGMWKRTGEYARVAKMDVESFTSLLREDANEAFIRVMEGLRGDNAEMEALVANMGDLGVDGTRAVTVLGTLSNNTEILRAQQRLANEAFEEGISLTNEFEVKNTNLAAQRDKAKKLLEERIKLLGEKLYPLLTLCTSGMSLMTRVLITLIDFGTKHGTTLLWIAGAVGAYTVAVKANAIAEKARQVLVNRAIALGTAEIANLKLRTLAMTVFTGSVKAAGTAIKKFLVTLATNPIGLVTLALTGLIAAFVRMKKEIEETGRETQASLERVKEAGKAFAREAAMEQMTIDRLFGKLEGLTKGTKEYQKAKDDILSRYGQYLGGMDEEIRKLENVQGAYEAISRAALQATRDKIIASATEKAQAAYVDSEMKNLEKIRELFQEQFGAREASMYFEKIRESLQKNEELPKALEELIAETFKESKTFIGDKFSQTTIEWNPVEDAIGAIRKSKATLQKEVDSVNELLGGMGKRTKSGGMNKLSYKNGDNGDSASLSPTTLAIPNFEEEIVKLKEQYAKQLVTKEYYETKMDSLELGHLEYRLKNEATTEEEKLKLREQIAEKIIAINNRVAKSTKAITEEEDINKLVEVLFESESNSRASQEEASFNDMTSRSRETTEEGSGRLAKANKTIRDGALQRYGIGMEQNGELENLEAWKEQEFELIQSFRDRDILSHEEAEAAKAEITRQYNQKRLKEIEAGVQAANNVFTAGTNVFTMLKERELDAAGDNEEKKEEIRKKYAKKEQAMAIAQAVTSGALAIMRIWEGKISGNPLIDSVIKAALTAVQVAQNAVQVATIRSQQFARGRYPVTGADDGITYEAEYIGIPTTGIRERPTLGLFSEKSPELVVDGNTTRKLVFNYPEIYRGILDISKGRTPQFAEGRYPSPLSPTPMTTGNDNAILEKMNQMMQANIEMMKELSKKELSLKWYGKGGMNEMIKKAEKYERSLGR